MSLVTGLSCQLGPFRLDIPRWELPDQGVSALWGPSGSGKSTVLRSLVGLQAVPGMKWVYEGQDFTSMSYREKRFGVVFQNYELFPHMSVIENLRFAQKARGLKRDEAELARLLEQVDLAARKKDIVGPLSGGEKQRVALARALVGHPRYVFLDEPFSSLDTGSRRQARELVKSVITEHNIPTLLITHDKADIDVLADHIFYLDRGRLRAADVEKVNEPTDR